MLEIRPNCERCNVDLDPMSTDVMICTYECTWCRDCAAVLGVCPNCGGEMAQRPRPSAARMAKDPPSTIRVFNPDLMAPESD
ncbi:DUF1272 domain-containing protein [Aeromicrobium sp.]|uniref:DUF1272 domain-containing protein n=1 Tax=Aeromicrobium sp. TaxID=1871063 RepID=UPI002FC7976B